MDTYAGQVNSIIHDIYEKQLPYDQYLRNKYDRYKHVCIFGAGNVGKPTAKEMLSRDIKLDFFCDNDVKKHGTIIQGLPCISLQELRTIKDDTMVIICGRAYEDIKRQLTQMGFSYIDRLHVNKFRIRNYFKSHSEKELVDHWLRLLSFCEDDVSQNICFQLLQEWCDNESNSLKSISTNDQYFCEDIIRIDDDEVIVDGGAYTGDTLQQFLDRGCSFKKYYMFEISKSNYELMQKYVESLGEKYRNKLVVLNSGLSNRTGTIIYSEDDEGARVVDGERDGKQGIVTTIDEACGDSKVSFIKMDIEGSELDALMGAENVIKKNHPKLAICIYHRPEDMWEIPEFIKSLCPGYRIYIRHHTDLMNETVCYAI